MLWNIRLVCALASLSTVASVACAQEDHPAATHDAPDVAAETTEEQAPFRLNLPEWNPDPESLPPELRPLDVVRPVLPEDVAAEVAELEARIAELEPLGLSAETRAEQNAALDEAIELAERVLALRVEHQGNTDGVVRWRDAAGEPVEWHEVIAARRTLADLQVIRGLDDAARAELASLGGTNAEVVRLYGAGDFTGAQAITERQLDIHRRVLGDEHPSALESIGNMGVLLQAQGKLSEAEPYNREALEGRRRVLGGEHPNTLTSINNMGLLLQAQGKLAEAEPYYREALEARRLVSGDDHPDTLASINNMGFVLQAQGKLAEAEPYYREALEGRRRVLGGEHPNTLTSINNMGALLRSQGKLAEAEPYFREALEARRRVLGGDHPSTLGSINNMGTLLRSQGKTAEAEPYYREALEGYRRVLGDDHSSTLTSINNMGWLLEGQGKLAEAEAYYREALEGRRHVLGDEHPDTLLSIHSMGALLRSQGKLTEAERYLRTALDGRRRVLGEEHRDTLNTINSIGVLLRSQGKPTEAERYLRTALDGRRRVLGEEHPETLTSMHEMGAVLRTQGKLGEAEPYLRAAVDGRLRVLGEEHPYTLTSMHEMGAVLRTQGKLSEAELYLYSALQGRLRSLGQDHANTLMTINSIAVVFENQGRYAEAELYHREALDGNRRVLGDEHPHTLGSINNMGGLLQSLGRLAEAESYYREALRGQRRVLGNEHSDTLNSINNMGALLSSQDRYAEAEAYYREALEGLRRVLGDEHPSTLNSINNMGALLTNQGKLTEAEPYTREALEGLRRALGDEHPQTLSSINNMGALLRDQGRLAESELYFREALATAERLRIDIAGDASARAQFAGSLRLPGIAAAYARTLVELGRPAEALAVLERGRGRAGLDMFAGGRSAAEAALRATADPDRLARYDAALEAEESAQRALFEAESRLSAALDEDKAEWTRRVQEARRSLNERTASVFAELRGLVPTLDPLPAERMLAALAPGEALLTYAFTDDGAIALVARASDDGGQVRGVTLAKDKDEAEALREAIADLRSAIASRPSAGEAMDVGALAAARKAAAPEELRALLDGAGSVIVVVDGPLAGLPMELLLEDLQIAYAPTATIALRPRLDGDARSSAIASSAPLGAGVVLGDPIFAGFEREEPDYPETGILLAMVTEGDNAAIAGLTRGDVLLSYGEHELASAEDLVPAIGATAEALATRGVAEDARPVAARVWRDGKEIEVALALGRMGVQLDQRPPADGLRSMATFDRSADALAANASALEQVRFYGVGLSPLPNTRLEAAAVAAMLGDEATLLLGVDATAPRLRAAVESNPPRVLHLATHGLLGSANRPLLASLALTAPDEPTGEDNGFVTLGDILATWGAQLGGTELVALSACDTAQGVRQGDTMMALPLGLLIAGADSVLASLWKVDDRATALLMARFYANWLGKAESTREIDGVMYSAGEAMPKLAALREAQVWLRSLTTDDLDRLQDDTGQTIAQSVSRDPSPRRARLADASETQTVRHPYNHPYYWAAFVLYGSPE